jgi:hypothetical protein
VEGCFQQVHHQHLCLVKCKLNWTLHIYHAGARLPLLYQCHISCVNFMWLNHKIAVCLGRGSQTFLWQRATPIIVDWFVGCTWKNSTKWYT